MPANSEPYIELLTPHASYAEGLHTRFDASNIWTHVAVTLAELTTETSFALVVCPALDCDLVSNPSEPVVKLLLSESDLCIESCSTESRVVGLRGWNKGRATEFSLHFSQDLEFWDFMRIVSRVMLDSAVRLEELMEQVQLVVDSIPSHEPSPSLESSCSHAAHRHALEENEETVRG